MKYVISIVIGYLLGCINNAYLISKVKGFDIREKGTHNAGASNMKLQLGWGYGVLTALLDIAKGTVAVFLARYLYPDTSVCWFAAGAMAVMGHIFPFYMNFKGGKGYATYVGFMLGIDWRVGVACIIYGVIATLVINYIAISTITTVIAVPFWFLYRGES
ncbi:MAG: glycerol-3-phosphate acyltransferase, partial [Erysipelotrichaceae bacterium]|nr:glycerol-3-phosphate acyltransferase [Erysipelotrichaceae bacterium]